MTFIMLFFSLCLSLFLINNDKAPVSAFSVSSSPLHKAFPDQKQTTRPLSSRIHTVLFVSTAAPSPFSSSSSPQNNNNNTSVSGGDVLRSSGVETTETTTNVFIKVNKNNNKKKETVDDKNKETTKTSSKEVNVINSEDNSLTILALQAGTVVLGLWLTYMAFHWLWTVLSALVVQTAQSVGGQVLYGLGQALMFTMMLLWNVLAAVLPWLGSILAGAVMWVWEAGQAAVPVMQEAAQSTVEQATPFFEETSVHFSQATEAIQSASVSLPPQIAELGQFFQQQ